MVLASWLNHEEIRETKIKIIVTEDVEEPLWAKVELPSLHLIISIHNLIEKYTTMEKIYKER